MKPLYAREIRAAIIDARHRFHPTRHSFPYEFVRKRGFLPTRSPLYMEAWRRSGGDLPPTVPPPHPSATAPVRPAQLSTRIYLPEDIPEPVRKWLLALEQEQRGKPDFMPTTGDPGGQIITASRSQIGHGKHVAL
jgi:hypothetical protein